MNPELHHDCPMCDEVLVERIAEALAARRKARLPWRHTDPAIRAEYLRDARAALAVIREDQS